MVDIDKLLEKFKEKNVLEKQENLYENNIIDSTTTQIFTNDFADMFENIISLLNEKIGSRVVNFKPEGKIRFTVEGEYHRIIFQKLQTKVEENTAEIKIIPLCVWKGVTKHLMSVIFYIDLESKKYKYCSSFDTVEEYAKNILGNLAEDKDFPIGS